MNVGLIAESKTKDIENLLEAFKSKKLDAEFIDVGSIGVTVENNVSRVFYEKTFEDFDSVFLSLPMEFTLFVEPLLSELVDAGTYCQLKPNSYHPLLYNQFLQKL